MKRPFPKLVLAPLAGFTDAPFRKLCASFGADSAVTEMVSAAALAHGSSPTRHLLETLPGEAPRAAQIFGCREDDVAFAAREISSLGRFASIDLNTGCPVPRIRHEGSGAALLDDPAKIGSLLAAMKREAGGTPVTLKPRPGVRPDAPRMLEIVAAAEEAGVSGITLHARFSKQGHGGEVHLDLLAECVRSAHVPVTGNGGVTDGAAFRAMAETGVAAVMVGRAAIDFPEIFAILKNGGERPDRENALPAAEIYARHSALVREYAERLAKDFPEDEVMTPDELHVWRFRSHFFRYFAGMDGAPALRRAMTGFRTPGDVAAAVAALRPARTSARRRPALSHAEARSVSNSDFSPCTRRNLL